MISGLLFGDVIIVFIIFEYFFELNAFRVVLIDQIESLVGLVRCDLAGYLLQ